MGPSSGKHRENELAARLATEEHASVVGHEEISRCPVVCHPFPILKPMLMTEFLYHLLAFGKPEGAREEKEEVTLPASPDLFSRRKIGRAGRKLGLVDLKK